MATQVDTDVERGFAQLYEIQKRFLNGSLSPLAARQPLQDIIEGRFSASNRFDRYKPHLLGLEDQLNLWEVLDANVWNGQVKANGWFDSVDTTSNHIQSVDDLEIFYIEFGSPELNIEAYWKAIKVNQPNVWRYNGLKTDPEHFRLAPQARQYEPGIHRIRINLVAHWEPEDGRSVSQVRQQASLMSEAVAAAEVMAAYAVQYELLRQQDGRNLPYADMAGYEATVPGAEAWAGCPYIYWNQVIREVSLDAGWSDSVNDYWAVPVLRES